MTVKATEKARLNWHSAESQFDTERHLVRETGLTLQMKPEDSVSKSVAVDQCPRYYQQAEYLSKRSVRHAGIQTETEGSIDAPRRSRKVCVEQAVRMIQKHTGASVLALRWKIQG